MPEISTPVSSRLFYRRMGFGPAIVLLHGFPESGSLWRNIQAELSASFTLIIPDLPGSGGSALNGDTSIIQMAQCVRAIMDAERIEKAVIAGHSMGGYVGLALAALYPEMVCGLSLVHSTPQPDDEERKSMRRKAIALVQKGAGEAFIRQMVPNLFSDPFKLFHPDLVEGQVALALEIGDAGIINFYNAMINRDSRIAMLDTVIFPMQWILGMNDNVVHYEKMLAFAHTSAVNFVSLYNDCGHMSMLEAPGKLIADLKKFTNFSYKHRPE